MVELEKKEMSILAENKANSLLDAISIVAEGVVKKYQYDQTIEAKILSVARRDEGIYKCEYENAIFDAYASGTQNYYENETVYVNIPKGDFSKQKHIVGRKVDLEEAPNRTFNFKMPFDDFVGLESLTIESPYTREASKGFLANYPEHGSHQEVDANYLTLLEPYQIQLAGIDETYNTTLKTIESNKATLLSYLENSWLNIIKASCNVPDSRLKLYYGEPGVTYYTLLIEAYETGNIGRAATLFQSFVNTFNTTHNSNPNTYVSIGLEDKTALIVAADKYEKLAKEAAQLAWNNSRNTIITEMQTQATNFTTNNYSHLWSWKNRSDKPKPLIETKLGLSLDIRTDLGTYMPQQGEYGLRIVVTGITKPTEEEASTTKTIETLWTNDQMYGNTYAFYTPYTQQRILDISNFLTLDRVDIFFYQNTDTIIDNGYYIKNGQRVTQTMAYNFVSDQGELIPYTYQDQDGSNYLLPFNIYYNNLEVLLGLTTDECSTDRTLLYTYDDVMYGEDPFDPNARSAKDTRELKFAWIHKTESGDIVLVDHVQKKNDADLRALESYDAQIYWYHYNYGCAQDTTLLTHKYGGVNWEFLEDEKLTHQARIVKQVNEETGEVTSTTEYYDTYGKFNIEVVPNIERAKEKWKAIVVCKGVPYTSTPLVFTNIDTGVETDAIDRVNEIAFRILRETVDDKGNLVLKEDNSLTSFFVYDENGRAIESDENLNWAEIWFYIQVWIRNNDDGTYTPLALAVDDDWDGDTFEIEWHYPTGNSMITDISPVTNQDLQNSQLAATVESNSEGFNEAIRRCTRKFRIKQFWDMRALDNTIAAIVKRNGRLYKPQQEFLFGQSGSMGTPYTVGILQDSPENGNLIYGESFTIRAVVYDATGHPAPNKNYIFTWELLAPTKITKGKNDYGDAITSKKWNELFEELTYEDDGQGNINNVLTAHIRSADPPVFRVTVTGAADYPISQTTGFSLVDQSTTNSNYRINCPSKVEFRSDGKIPTTINSKFEVHKIEENDSQLIYPTWNLKQWKYFPGTKTYNARSASQIQYVGLKTTTVVQKDLNINYAVPIYYRANSNGTINWSYYNFTLEPNETTGYTNASNYLELTNALEQWWDNLYESSRTQTYYINLYNTIKEKLSAVVKQKLPTYTEYSLDPYVGRSADNNTPWQWEDELGELYYTVIGYDKDGTYFKQAIPFTRNVYSSSLINSWDGTTLELDNENSAVLAKMLSAGAKDGNGRFTGVIMGDWHEKGDTSIDTPGLYGFKYGAQVFGLLTDGTGFIGKSGRGRIEFDGNQSLISNSDKTCYINLDPVQYSLNENGIIDLTETPMGFSQYFLYAKTKKATPASYLDGVSSALSGVDKLEQSFYWTKQFLDDTENDYFIVDPNNGVLTSGGIIARYGKIGNWIISDTGLYQRVTDTKTPLNGRYMYLGYDPSNESDNKYMIYAGYAPPDSIYSNDIKTPMFTVDWRGYFTARAGKIGLNSPWFISDNGLVQTVKETLTDKDFYSTIFLGNAKARSDKKGWSDNLADLDGIELLMNDSVQYSDGERHLVDGRYTTDWRGPEVWGYSDEDTPTRGNFAIYAGGNGWVREYNPATLEFTRKWVNDKTIKFGVRTDGTLYSMCGQLGYWRLSDTTLSSLDDAIVLDGKGSTNIAGNIEKGPKIVLGHGRTILFSNGKIKLLNTADGGTSGTACIELADYQLSTSTSAHTGGNLEFLQSISNAQGSASSPTSETFTVDWKYSKVGSKEYSWSTTSTVNGTSTTNNKTIANPNYFSIWETGLNYGGEHSGIDIVTGKIVDDNGNETSTIGTILYATGTTQNYATLGTSTRPWNIFANSISGGSAKLASLFLTQDCLYLGGSKAATEPWVIKKLAELAKLIKSTTTGAGSATLQGFTAGNNLGDALSDLLDGVTVLGGNEATGWSPKVTQTDGSITLNYTRIQIPAIMYKTAKNTDGGVGKSGLVQTATRVQFDIAAENLKMGGYAKLIDIGNSTMGIKWSKTDFVDDALYRTATATAHCFYKVDSTATTDSNGKVTITFTQVDATTQTVTFDQADTAFFKARALKGIYAGRSSDSYTLQAERSSASSSSTLYFYDTIPNKVVTASYSYNNGAPYVYTYLRLVNWNDGTLAIGYLGLDASAAYKAGWNAARNQVSYDYSTGIISRPKYDAPGESESWMKYTKSSHSWDGVAHYIGGTFDHYEATSHSYTASSLSSV